MAAVFDHILTPNFLQSKRMDFILIERHTKMCDYSLMSVPNRLAVAGEELVTHRFQSGSIGLASPQARHKGFWETLKRSFSPPATAAVCIPPGARLILHDIKPHMQREISVGPVEEVTFTQISAAENNYR